MYEKIQHLQPHVDEIIPNRKFFIHNYIKKILKNNKQNIQTLVLACGWDPILVKLSEEFPQHSFFGIDNESTQLQEQLIQKIIPQSLISYLNINITKPEKLIQQLSAKGWKKNQPSCLVIEGISYYIPKEIFWNSLKALTQTIQAPCFICGDFLVDWTQQKVSHRTQNLGSTIFNMIKDTCSQNYYFYTTKQIKKHLQDLGFDEIQFSTQDQIQKQRTENQDLWKKDEGHIQLFSAENTG